MLNKVVQCINVYSIYSVVYSFVLSVGSLYCAKKIFWQRDPLRGEVWEACSRSTWLHFWTGYVQKLYLYCMVNSSLPSYIQRSGPLGRENCWSSGIVVTTTLHINVNQWNCSRTMPACKIWPPARYIFVQFVCSPGQWFWMHLVLFITIQIEMYEPIHHVNRMPTDIFPKFSESNLYVHVYFLILQRETASACRSTLGKLGHLIWVIVSWLNEEIRSY